MIIYKVVETAIEAAAVDIFIVCKYFFTCKNFINSITTIM